MSQITTNAPEYKVNCRGGFLRFTQEEWEDTLLLLMKKKQSLVREFMKRSMQLDDDKVIVRTGDDCIFRDSTASPPFHCTLQLLLGLCPGYCDNPPKV